MKEYIQTAVIFVIFLALIPCLAFAGKKGETTQTSAEKTKNYEDFMVSVYFTEENICETYTLDEYMIGAVMAQMPADFEQEALKAQAVLARTYILRRYESEKQSPTAALHGALISDDENLYQGFVTEEKAKEFYGDEYESAYIRISESVKSADGILTYEDEPVIAAFHAASSGYTESAETAWGQKIPYLQAVESESDAKLKGIETQTTVTDEEFKKRISEKYDIKFSDDKENWLEISEINERGYVTSLSVCGEKIPVSEFTDLMEISSPCFESDQRDGKFIFTSKGFGHLVGMSQYGANSMAAEGADYKEILLHYYTGCEISEFEY